MLQIKKSKERKKEIEIAGKRVILSHSGISVPVPVKSYRTVLFYSILFSFFVILILTYLISSHLVCLSIYSQRERKRKREIYIGLHCIESSFIAASSTVNSFISCHTPVSLSISTLLSLYLTLSLSYSHSVFACLALLCFARPSSLLSVTARHLSYYIVR